MQPLAVGGLGRVGVRACVDQQVSVGWPAAEEAALGRRDRRHSGTDPDLDAVAFALGQATEHAHDHVVGFIARTDRTANFGHPQRHLEVLEDREGEPVLVAVERPVWFADHHRVEAAVRVLRRCRDGCSAG